MSGMFGPEHCGQDSRRIRFFSSIIEFERRHTSKPAHVGYECVVCGRVKIGASEEEAATRFRDE